MGICNLIVLLDTTKHRDTKTKMWKETFLITLLFVLSTDSAQPIDARSAEATITEEPSAGGETGKNGDEAEILIYTKNVLNEGEACGMVESNGDEKKCKVGLECLFEWQQFEYDAKCVKVFG